MMILICLLTHLRPGARTGDHEWPLHNLQHEKWKSSKKKTHTHMKLEQNKKHKNIIKQTQLIQPCTHPQFILDWWYCYYYKGWWFLPSTIIYLWIIHIHTHTKIRYTKSYIVCCWPVLHMYLAKCWGVLHKGKYT